jgi:hypothetical protein
LTIHLVLGTIGRGGVARILEVAAPVLLELLDAAGGGLILSGDLGTGLVADGRQLDGAAGLLLVAGGGGSGIGRGSLRVSRAGSNTSAIFIGLALVLLLLLAGLPLLADLLKLCLWHQSS